MAKSKRYIFTDKQHPKTGIMSTVFGMLSSITLSVAILLSYKKAGDIPVRFGVAAFYAVIFMIIGFILGIWSFTEKKRFRLFSILGIAMNGIAFCILTIILYAGAYVS